MKPTITRFNDKTGDFEITIPVPFTLKDGIEYADMIIVDIPKYEDTKDYNVFDLIRENQELKKQLEESINSYTEENALRHKMSLDLNTVKTKQKEFIEWLEHYKKALLNVGSKKTIDCVLEKHKEIVGGLDD